jgi:hypothetical protein
VLSRSDTPDHHGLPTPRSTLRDSSARVLVWARRAGALMVVGTAISTGGIAQAAAIKPLPPAVERQWIEAVGPHIV